MDKSKNYSLATIITTYNRIDMLQECVRAVRSQTYPMDEIIVINNGSTDGTVEWLDAQTDLTVVHQGNDYAAAGAYYTGFKVARERGHDWMWVVNDDGVAADDALEKLTKHIADDVAILNCLVLATQDPEMLWCPVPHRRLDHDSPVSFLWYNLRRRGRPVYRYVAELKGASADGKTYQPWSTLFNGSLISSKMIRIAGTMNKEMVMAGDELDMMHRLGSVGKEITVLDSIFYHPFKYTSGAVPVWKIYYGVRNSIYMNNKYLNAKVLRNFYTVYRHFLHAVQPWRGTRGLKLLMMGVRDGFLGKLGNPILPEEEPDDAYQGV